MHRTLALSSTPADSRGAAAVTTAFAALVIGVGTILVTSASAASVGPADSPPASDIGVDQILETPQPTRTDVDPTVPPTRPPIAAAPTAATPDPAATDGAPELIATATAHEPAALTTAAPLDPVPSAGAADTNPTSVPNVDASSDGTTTAARSVEALRPVTEPMVAPPVEVVFGLGDAPAGCADGCITAVSVEQIVVGSTDMVLTAESDTPAEFILAMMALDQGEDPVGGDPYAASHGLATEWTVALVDLLPATTYEYAVIAIDEQGGIDTFGGTFTTALQLTDQITQLPIEICSYGCAPLDLAGRSTARN